MQGLTDNAGNTFIIRKLYTSAFPTAAVLMQLASALSKKRLWLSLDWLPQESDKEADALTNEEFDDFTPNLRINVDWKSLPFGVMNQLLALSPRFAKTKAVLREAKAAGPRQAPLSKKAKMATATKWQ